MNMQRLMIFHKMSPKTHHTIFNKISDDDDEPAIQVFAS